MRQVAVFGAIAAVSFAWDSRNISASEWICLIPSPLSVKFSVGEPVECSTEVLQDVSQTMPEIRYFNASAPLETLYTVIIVDRDAPSQSSPIKSPLRHYAAGNIAAVDLASGFIPTSAAWFNYSGPQPPAGSRCHRYYVMLYEQAPNITPALFDPTQRLLWDFPEWASNNSLTKIGVNFWQSQNLSVRTSGCSGGGGGGNSARALSSTEIICIVVASCVVISVGFAAAFRLRSRCVSAKHPDTSYVPV
jgi:hypothetical protein